MTARSLYDAGPHQVVALFKKDGAAAQTGGDMNHLAIKVANGTYESIKADPESHGIARATTAAFISTTPTATPCS